ncbi:hypothetical protein [Streptomyces phytophilus]|uniref:hypothetical protein n=1 Tax=Streptomyces phytophilus TaxID=722715 RepID=UPI00215D6201|nr:hypothetical protein [Streptomyces phytophilus]
MRAAGGGAGGGAAGRAMANSTAIGAHRDGKAAAFDDEADRGLPDDAGRAARPTR